MAAPDLVPLRDREEEHKYPHGEQFMLSASRVADPIRVNLPNITVGQLLMRLLPMIGVIVILIISVARPPSGTLQNVADIVSEITVCILAIAVWLPRFWK
jgi:hypothetical protein